ncbi:choline dehydrogenase-like flavoprotein [Rhizobium halophytocola]|uniref:Choline dehydrogenase-like flavoprotein n=2 Tax=Rhizobium halophytocola TaxID=735519 RepID=A0ABS4E0U4_9HYPH|nr:choline dehydrogenase-like flavoprotein [Rhizobium halophytocola]
MAAGPASEAQYDYIVVGSGAGGGTLAARLAEAGARVLLIEAGGDPRQLQGSDPAYPDQNRLPDDYDVPVLHPFASENTGQRWEFFVRHYNSQQLQERDPKFVPEENGIFYPRAGTLGGCTAHNAQIFVYPHNEDWDYIAELTGDDSWNRDAMRKIFQRMENCEHRFFLYRWLAKLGLDWTRHGWNGWLTTQKAVPIRALGDEGLVATIFDSAAKAIKEQPNQEEGLDWFVESQGDPNDWRLVSSNATGLRYPPLTNRNHQRIGSRERVLEVKARHPDRLTLALHTLVTRVLFDDHNRAVGVEIMEGERLYRAAWQPSETEPERKAVYCAKEVILSGGAFNTPQLLMLSGIGPKAELEKHGIAVRVDLPGVGLNMQDRYEVGVVNEMNRDWEVLTGAKFAAGDPQYGEWSRRRHGVYTTNGAILAVIKRSLPERPLPDLFCFGLLGLFKGYFPGYSALFPAHLNYLTWAILKAHTVNTAGTVTLRSADPRDPPQIDFRYFEEGNDENGADLDSVVAGIKFVRTMTAKLMKKGLIVKEHLPGVEVQTDAQLKQFVRDHAWGHHASCTCSIGPRDRLGVLSGDFKVHGVSGLRVVDASVFPRIPGFFIVSAVYMVGEKAADVIIKQSGIV